MKRYIKALIFAFTASYIALLPQFYEIFDKESRFTELWDFRYYAAIVSAVAVLAAVYAVGYWICFVAWKLPPRWQTVRDVVLVILLVAVLSRTVVAIIIRSGFAKTYTPVLDYRISKIDYYLLLPALVTLLNPHVVKRMVRRFYSFLAPMMMFGMVWPATFERYNVQDPPLPPELETRLDATSAPGTTNIYIFMCDEWSYLRMFPGNRLIDHMPNFEALLKHATLYENARSPGPATAISVPRFLFQNNKEFSALGFYEVRAKCLSAARVDGPSLFSDCPPGWFKLAVGFWVNYPAMLGHNVDFAEQIQKEAGIRSYHAKRADLLLSQFGWLRYIGVHNTGVDIQPCLSWMFSLQEAHRLSRVVIEQVNEPTFGYFHYCLPHYPYVWYDKGRKWPLPDQPEEHTVQNYMDNIRYLDRVIGEVIASLKKAGKYDSSMLVFTSDHSWRWEPTEKYPDWKSMDVDEHCELRHVPLIIKFPGQKQARVVAEPVATSDLHLTIRKTLEALAAGKDPSI